MYSIKTINMKDILNDYRCTCKKLLLKGFIFVGEIEIRCRFCKKTSTISGLNGSLSTMYRYVLISDDRGKILKATTSAVSILGYSDAELKKMHVHEVITSLSPNMYEKIWSHLDADIVKSLLFKGEETQKGQPAKPIQIGARTLRSQLDGQKIFIFDVNRKVPQKLEELTFLTSDKIA